MAHQNLFFPICGSLLVLLVLVAAMWGTKARYKFVIGIRNAYKDKEKLNRWTRRYGHKQRVLLSMAVVSIIGIIGLGSLILAGASLLSNQVMIILIALILICVLSGTIIIRDYEKLAK